MKKSLVALAIAGLSTAALAQSNVTIYGVADVSAQGYSVSKGKAISNSNGQTAQGGTFNLTNNSSLMGFKGTEELGNGNKALFQIETNVNMTGGSAVAAGNGNAFTSMRDSYVGLGTKYGNVLGGYLSTPYRTAVNSFDVMPGGTGSGKTENILGKIRLNSTNVNGVVNQGGIQYDNSVRATALAYALPANAYGINGSIAYTGSANNGLNNNTTQTLSTTSVTTVAPQNALALGLGWEGYGVGIKGAFQQAKINNTMTGANIASGYTSYLVGAQYTGVPGLKVSAVYNRNTLGTNANGTVGAGKGSNNQFYVGASYRFGNNEPRIAYSTTSNTSGLSTQGYGQDGGTQWTGNWGYYLSKRTQVYGLVSQVRNNANGVWVMGTQASNVLPTGGQTVTTYGAGLRTNF